MPPWCERDVLGEGREVRTWDRAEACRQADGQTDRRGRAMGPEKRGAENRQGNAEGWEGERERKRGREKECEGVERAAECQGGPFISRAHLQQVMMSRQHC